MISALTGELRRVDDDRVLIKSGAFVLQVLVPVADLTELQVSLGEEVTLHTIFDLEGDPTRGGLTPRLIGFLRPEDKKFFELFTTVKGIGPKRALRALNLPVGQIAQAIESKDTRFLIQLPEIGKRTAEQIVAELAGKMKEFATEYVAAGGAPTSGRAQPEEDAIEGCMALGVPRPDAERLLDRAKAANPTLKTTQSLLMEMLRMRTARG